CHDTATSDRRDDRPQLRIEVEHLIDMPSRRADTDRRDTPGGTGGRIDLLIADRQPVRPVKAALKSQGAGTAARLGHFDELGAGEAIGAGRLAVAVRGRSVLEKHDLAHAPTVSGRFGGLPTLGGAVSSICVPNLAF